MTVALASIRAWWIVRFSSHMTSTHIATTTSGVIAADVYKQLCISTTRPKQQLMIDISIPKQREPIPVPTLFGRAITPVCTFPLDNCRVSVAAKGYRDH